VAIFRAFKVTLKLAVAVCWSPCDCTTSWKHLCPEKRNRYWWCQQLLRLQAFPCPISACLPPWIYFSPYTEDLPRQDTRRGITYLFLLLLPLGTGLCAVTMRLMRSSKTMCISRTTSGHPEQKGVPEHIVNFQHALKTPS
jgi:hypothetical protein